MKNGKDKIQMTKTELQELLDLRGWSRTDLASALGLTENAVNRWFLGDRTPANPTAILLQTWLNEARKAKEAVA